MNRPLTAVFSALEALLVVGIGIGIPLLPLTLMWAFQYGLQLDWLVFWRAAVDTWLVGHGVDVRMTLDPATALAAGFDGAGTPFVVTIGALGFALLTVLLGVRAGRRVAETPHRAWGASVSIGVFALASAGVTLSALHPAARPSIWQGTLLPTLVFAIAVLTAAELTRLRRQQHEPDAAPSRFSLALARVPDDVRVIVVHAARGGAAAAMIVVAISAVAVTVLIAVNYAPVIALYEGVHAGVLGGVALTVAQLALLPNLVLWAAAWFVGPGFAIGTGSWVGPLGTSLGPVPAVPILGALPTGDLALGFAGLLVPVLAGFAVGVAVRPALVRALGDRATVLRLAAVGVGVGVIGGALLGLLAAASAGSAGPGRLADVGPNAWLVALFALLEFGVPAVVGLLAARRTS